MKMGGIAIHDFGQVLYNKSLSFSVISSSWNLILDKEIDTRIN